MQLDFNEARWPELSAFRKACLANRFNEMGEIASRSHEWYANENPENSAMPRLALIFQAQYCANVNNRASVAGTGVKGTVGSESAMDGPRLAAHYTSCVDAWRSSDRGIHDRGRC